MERQHDHADSPAAAPNHQHAAAPVHRSHEHVLGLQGTVGNAATARLIGNLPSIGNATATPRPLPPVGLSRPRGAWQQALTELSALTGTVRAPMLAADGAAAAPSGSLRSAADQLEGRWSQLGSGAEVPSPTRQPYEQSYGHDLGAARMHVGTPASRAVTSALGVQALTVGNHMLFSTPPNDRVLGHELAHVVQQSRRSAAPANPTLRAAAPGSLIESDADRAAAAALGGRPYRLGPAGGEDLAMIPPLAIAAIVALIVGAGLAVTAEVSGPSYEENQRRAQARHNDPSVSAWMHAGWLWVPVGGTMSRIWEAQSPFERYFNVAMMPLDVLTMGALGSAALKVANPALWRTALTQAGERELAELGQVGIRAAGAAEVQSSARAALEAGHAVVATVGRRNHALVFVKVGGKYYRLTGGISRSMKVAPMQQFSPRNINAYYAFRGGEATGAAILAEAQSLSTGVGLGFSFRSCGLSAARLAETGLLAEGGAGLRLAGGRAFFPVTVMGTLAERGTVTMSQQGAQRMILGTGFNFALLGSARGAATVASNMDDFAATIVSKLVPDGQSSTAPQDPAISAMIQQTEVSPGAIDAALDAGAAGDITLAEVPDEYLNLYTRVGPADGGQGQAPELIPVYSFIAAETEQLASQAPPPAPNQCVDHTARSGPEADSAVAMGLARHPQFAEGAQNLARALRRAPQDQRDGVISSAHDYFPFSFQAEEDRAAAILACEREGIAGQDLDRVTAALSR